MAAVVVAVTNLNLETKKSAVKFDRTFLLMIFMACTVEDFVGISHRNRREQES